MTQGQRSHWRELSEVARAPSQSAFQDGFCRNQAQR
jgi:hypothetical protein